MFLTHEQNLDAPSIVKAVLSIPLAGGDGGRNATYEGQCGEDDYLVFRVGFPDPPRSVCLRVERPRHQDAAATILARVDAERRTYEALAAAAASGRFRWSARLLGASLTFDNPIRYPFLLLDSAGGRRLAWSAASPPQPARASLLARLAAIQTELIQCTLETRKTTACEYFEQRLQHRLGKIRRGELPELVEQDVLDQLALLPLVLGGDADSRHFALEHADLAADSIILRSSSSDRYIIETIIDWGPAEMVPLCQAARFPSLLRSWGDDDDVPRETTLEDRALYVASYASDNSTVATRAMRCVQTGSDVDFRTLYWESVKSESMLLTAMARSDVGWMLPFSRLRHGEEEGWRDTACAEVGEVESASFDLCSIYSDTVAGHDDDE